MAKPVEMTYREVNIGLANQFARFADSVGIDVQKVSSMQLPAFSQIHTPGIAVGDHCIPVYPWPYLSTDADATVVATARAANAAMPEYAVSRRVAAGVPGRAARRRPRRVLRRQAQGDRLLRRLHPAGAPAYGS